MLPLRGARCHPRESMQTDNGRVCTPDTAAAAPLGSGIDLAVLLERNGGVAVGARAQQGRSARGE